MNVFVANYKSRRHICNKCRIINNTGARPSATNAKVGKQETFVHVKDQRVFK